jgi:Fe(II)/alpha-ketoglutarate-dependent arginine beta-hydroxylase
MYRLEITARELEQVKQIIQEAIDQVESVEDEAFWRTAADYAQELPRSLRSALNNFRLSEPDSVCVIAGYPIDDEALGPTPCHWDEYDGTRTLGPDVYFFLLSCLLGEPIAWATQQNGRIVHDVVPIRAHVDAQLSSGSLEPLTWHTEDAFHPMRTDYVGLMCLRNPDSVETRYASTHYLDYDSLPVAVLWEKRFPIQPDQSHLPALRGARADYPPEIEDLLRGSYAWIRRLVEHPEPIAVLSGHRASPYLRLDPYFMGRVREDSEAQHALDQLVAAIDAVARGYVLRPGDVMFIDNYTAVHGREAFAARFDGTDRWLRRLNISRDLRKSRAHRASAGARVIF